MPSVSVRGPDEKPEVDGVVGTEPLETGGEDERPAEAPGRSVRVESVDATICSVPCAGPPECDGNGGASRSERNVECGEALGEPVELLLPRETYDSPALELAAAWPRGE
jgi:hypothetical protein